MDNYYESIDIKNFMKLYEFSNNAIIKLKNESYNGEIIIDVYRKGHNDKLIKKIFCINFFKNIIIEM